MMKKSFTLVFQINMKIRSKHARACWRKERKHEFPKAEDDAALAVKEPADCCQELCPITTL